MMLKASGLPVNLSGDEIVIVTIDLATMNIVGPHIGNVHSLFWLISPISCFSVI